MILMCADRRDTVVEPGAEQVAVLAVRAAPAVAVRQAARERGGRGGAITARDNAGEALFLPPDSSTCVGDVSATNPRAAALGGHFE